MQKSRLGISVGLLGAAVFLVCFFGGITPALLLGGYILLFEENAWLKKTAVRAVVLMFAFSLLSAVFYLIPNLITLIDNICVLFDGEFYLEFMDKIVNLFDSILGIGEKVLFLFLGFKAVKQSSVKLPVIDPIVDKYFTLN